MKIFHLLSSEFLSFDSKAMVGFYKLSGYLNLMEGNIPSLSHFMIRSQQSCWKYNYQLYFYALAKKANGNTKKEE